MGPLEFWSALIVAGTLMATLALARGGRRELVTQRADVARTTARSRPGPGRSADSW